MGLREPGYGRRVGVTGPCDSGRERKGMSCRNFCYAGQAGGLGRARFGHRVSVRRLVFAGVVSSDAGVVSSAMAIFTLLLGVIIFSIFEWCSGMGLAAWGTIAYLSVCWTYGKNTLSVSCGKLLGITQKPTGHRIHFAYRGQSSDRAPWRWGARVGSFNNNNKTSALSSPSSSSPVRGAPRCRSRP